MEKQLIKFIIFSSRLNKNDRWVPVVSQQIIDSVTKTVNTAMTKITNSAENQSIINASNIQRVNPSHGGKHNTVSCNGRSKVLV